MSNLAVTHVVACSETPGMAAFSGAENHLFILLPALRERGVDVELLMLLMNDGSQLKRKREELQSSGIAVRTFQMPTARGVSRAAKLFGAVRQMQPLFAERQSRIIHTHLEYADIYARAAAGRTKCRIVTSLHNDEPAYASTKWKLLSKVLDPRTAHYIAISDRVAKHASATLKIDPAKITRIYYGVEKPAAQFSRREIRQRWNIQDDAFVVGFVGRLTEQKNLETLLKAAAALPQINFVLVGAGECESALKVEAEGLRATNVQFMGFQPNAADLMPAFDLFCLPSKWEGLGLVLIEAMLRKVPIVGSDAGAIPEILGNGAYGTIFSSGNAGLLAEAIQECRNNYERVMKVADAAYEFACKNFTVASMTDSTIEVYESVMRKN